MKGPTTGEGGGFRIPSLLIDSMLYVDEQRLVYKRGNVLYKGNTNNRDMFESKIQNWRGAGEADPTAMAALLGS